jgi:4-oxalocrotonate tautomerase
MPYVNVRITKEDVSAEQKSRIIAEITQTLSRVLNKKPERTHVVIDEVELENWGIGGLPASEYRRQSD